MEKFIWKPTQEILDKANITRFMKKNDLGSYKELIETCKTDIEWFWEKAGDDLGVEWYKKYDDLLDGFLPFATWFKGGKINIVHNCLDRHQKDPATANKIAFIWEGDCGAVKKVTYAELYKQVNAFANGLKSLGVKKGDAIGIYMPMISEMMVAFFATLKLGAIVVPVFSGFGPEPLAIRMSDAKVKILITADGGLRRGKSIKIKEQADIAVAGAPTIEKVIVAKRLFDEKIPWNDKRDIWFDDLLKDDGSAASVILSEAKDPPESKKEILRAAQNDNETEIMQAEDTSLIIYTSGTTGKPKGTVHTHAGALLQIAKEVSYYMDCKKDDTFFWVTDIGWMMGPWEMIGCTFNAATFVIFEGAPDYPKPNRLWEVIEKHKVTILGISPTAIRLLKKTPLENITQHNLSTLRILGSTGEAWDPESYDWYFKYVGGERCPIINISGGTEIIGCHLSPLPIIPLKPCTLGGPGLGMDVDVWDENGKSLKNEVGYLVCKKPAPSMTKGFLNDKQRYLDTYFSKWPRTWNHGDWAIVDEDGYWFLKGRADDVIKVSGHRTGPAEIESALMTHPAVAECAAIGVPHEVKGESIVCFAVLKDGFSPDDKLRAELRNAVSAKLGKTLTPDVIKFAKALPKTRSAKIVRGTIKKKFLNTDLGDTSSIDNLDALEEIAKAI